MERAGTIIRGRWPNALKCKEACLFRARQKRLWSEVVIRKTQRFAPIRGDLQWRRFALKLPLSVVRQNEAIITGTECANWGGERGERQKQTTGRI